MGLLDVLRRPAKTATELRQKLAELRNNDPEPRGCELELKRRQLLLTGSDKELDAVESAIGANLRDQERFDLAVSELEKRITEADLAENAAQLSAECDAAEEEATACAAELRKEYPKAAEKIVRMFNRLKSAEAAVIAVNEKLALAGRAGELLRSVEVRAFKPPPQQAPHVYSLTNRTRLGTLGSVAPGWNADQDRAYFGDHDPQL